MAKMQPFSSLSQEAREAFEELAKLRATGRAEAIRRFEESIQAKTLHLKYLVTQMLANGEPPHQVIKSTGMSRQTITNYKKDYLASKGYESLAEMPRTVDWVEEGEPSMVESFRHLNGTVYTNGEEKYWYDPISNDFVTYDEKNGIGLQAVDIPQWLADHRATEVQILEKLDSELEKIIAQDEADYDVDLGL